MKKNKYRLWSVLVTVTALVFVVCGMDSMMIQRKLSSLADDIDKKKILSADLVYFPLDLTTQVPINTSSFEGVDSKIAEQWGIKQVSFGGASAERAWNEIAACLRSSRFSRSLLQINPFFPDLRIKVTFRSTGNEILGTLYFDGEGTYGLVDRSRGVYSGCLFSMIKHYMMGIH